MSGPILFRASFREVLHRVAGRTPAGIKSVLGRLPSVVLARDEYLRLIEILDDPGYAKLLYHVDGTEITDSTVRVLYEVPAVLRPTLAEVIRFIERIDRLEHLSQGLQWLASRGAAVSFDALAADLALRAQPAQFVARLKKLVTELPLPQTLPPEKIGRARRIDATADLCALAKQFQNCLASYTSQINAGACAIYLWDDPAVPTVCLVKRHGRLGWCLGEALGPGNTALDGQRLEEIVAAFADAEVPQYSAFRSLECILQANCTTRSRMRRQRRQNLERQLWELEEAGCIQEVIDAVA